MVDISTACVGMMSKSYQESYENKNIKTFPLCPGKEYGPFYYVGSKNFSPEVSSNEHNTFLGFTKPINKEDAEKLYNLKKWNSTFEYVHEVMINIPIGVTDAVVFVGSVDGGTGIQLNMNRSVCPYVVIKTVEMLV